MTFFIYDPDCYIFQKTFNFIRDDTQDSGVSKIFSLRLLVIKANRAIFPNHSVRCSNELLPDTFCFDQ